jgi:hypothetical protein
MKSSKALPVFFVVLFIIGLGGIFNFPLMPEPLTQSDNSLVVRQSARRLSE